MKKIVILILSLLLVGAFVGCAENNKEKDTDTTVSTTEVFKKDEKDEEILKNMQIALENETMSNTVEYNESNGNFIVTYTAPKQFLDSVKGSNFDSVRNEKLGYSKLKKCIDDSKAENRNLIINLKAENEDTIYFQVDNDNITIDKMK